MQGVRLNGAIGGRAARAGDAFGRAVLALLTGLVTLLLAAPAALAQELDVEPPLIGHERIERGEPGVPQAFTATVVDDREIAAVSLFHRRAGDGAFESVPLERVGSSSVFLATLTTEAGDTRAIEYYIEARDAAGNRVIRGYAFNPLRRLMSGETVGNVRPDDAPDAGPSRTWLWVGLGVLAVGAAVALSDSGDGGGGEPGDTFTVTIEPPR